MQWLLAPCSLLVEAQWLCLEEIKEFVRNSSVDGKINSKALLRLLSKFHDEIALPKKLTPLRSDLSFKKHTA